MRLNEIMSKDVHTVAPDLTAEDAYALMRQERVHHLAVVERGALVGIVSERDLGSSRGTAARRNRRVVELMTDRLVTASPDTTVRQAANLLRGHVIGCLPILDGRKVVGIVTTTDLLDLLGHGGGRGRPENQAWVLRQRGPRKRGAAIAATAQRARR